MIMIMIIMMKTNMMKTMINPINDGGNDVVKDNDAGRHDDEDA